MTSHYRRLRAPFTQEENYVGYVGYVALVSGIGFAVLFLLMLVYGDS